MGSRGASAGASSGADAGKRRVILGIDPGTVVTGFGVIRIDGASVTVVTHGAIKNRAGDPMPRRLEVIFSGLESAIRKYRPHEIAIETAFYGKNAQSALKLGQARGVAILSAVRSGKSPAEYSPREVKKAITGNGNASKRQVQYMLKSQLGLAEPIRPLDAADAIAVAICHSRRLNGSVRRYGGWKEFVKDNPRSVR